jgi:hypothetical protein
MLLIKFQGERMGVLNGQGVFVRVDHFRLIRRRN